MYEVKLVNRTFKFGLFYSHKNMTCILLKIISVRYKSCFLNIPASSSRSAVVLSEPCVSQLCQRVDILVVPDSAEPEDEPAVGFMLSVQIIFADRVDFDAHLESRLGVFGK